MKFRKKPVVIEAFRTREILWNAKNQWEKLPRWIQKAYEAGVVVFGNEEVYIKTLEGEMVAQSNDMIIQGVQGEIYPCKPDIFEATYEPA